MIDPKVAEQVDWSSAVVARMFRQWVEQEDVAQVMWLWVLEHQDQLEGMPPFTLRRRLKDSGIAYARKEKAQRSGYHPEDEYTYSQATILKLLPDAFDPAATQPVRGLDGGGGGKGERTHMEWETMVTDVRVGLDRIPYADVRVLKQVAAGTRSPNDLLAVDAMRRLQKKCNTS